MNKNTKKALLGYGLSTELIERIEGSKHTITNLKSFNKVQLEQYYSPEDAETIAAKIKRPPIDEKTLETIISRSSEVCAFCGNGNFAQPYQIHHIDLFSQTQDHSEGNLLLICPTHHVAIHKSKIPKEEQIKTRNEWYAVSEIWKKYREKGLQFNFDAFSAIDYSAPPDPVQIITDFQPSPSTSKELSKNQIGGEALGLLKQGNFVLLTGASGSGKSTFAIGIAGLFGSAGVFKSTWHREERREALKEIPQFIHMAVKNCILILDDINTWATADDVAAIAAATTDTVKIIATQTGSTHGENPRIEARVAGARIFISWEKLFPFVSKILLDNEAESVEALRKLRIDSIERTGYGPGDRTLRNLIEIYQKPAQTIAQFLFLLKDIERTIESEVSRLVEEGRKDVPVVFAAIEQIASVEQPVHPSFVTETIATRLPEKYKHLAETEWIQDVFSEMSHKRLMTQSGASFTTIHREWARAFICACLGHPEAKEVTEILLQRDFHPADSTIRRLVILYSWFRYDKNGGKFLRDWSESLDAEKVNLLLRRALESSLYDTAILSSDLYMRFHDKRRTLFLGEGLKALSHEISTQIQKATSDDWYALHELTMVIGNIVPEMMTIFREWSPNSVANILHETDPNGFGIVGTFFWSPKKHIPEWCEEVGKNLNWKSFLGNLGRVGPGNIRAIEDAIGILKQLKVALLRSMVSAIADVIAEKLSRCNLEDISFGLGIPMYWLEIFPDEIAKIINGINQKEMAAQYEKASPGNWHRLLHLSSMAAQHDIPFGSQIVDALDEKFPDLAVRFANTNHYQFRLLVHQLSYGSLPKRQRAASVFYSAVKDICTHDPSEKEFILKAYTRLDPASASTLCRELSLQNPSREAERDADLEKFPPFHTLPGFLDSLQKAEQAGDFDVFGFLGMS